MARNKRGRGEGIHAFFPRRESLFGNRMNTHVAHSFRSMRSHRAHSLSAESEAVSSESDNREWQCALVSGYWLKKGGVCVRSATCLGMLRSTACRTGPRALANARALYGYKPLVYLLFVALSRYTTTFKVSSSHAVFLIAISESDTLHCT